MSSSRQRYDLTQGDIFRRLLFLALPVMGGQFMQMAYNLADIFWLGRLSSDAVVAASTAGMFLWMSMGLMLMVRIGTEIGVAQNVGQGNFEAARGYAQTAFTLGVVLGIGFGAFMIFGRSVLVGFFNIPSQQVIDDAMNFMAIAGFSIPLFYASGVVAGSFSGFGNTRLPFVVQSIGLASNIALSPILIFGAGLGVVGAAYSLVLARSIEFGLSVYCIKRYGNRPFDSFTLFARPQRLCLRDIFRWGLPIAVEITTFSSLSMVLSRMVAYWGVSAMAVQRVSFQIESLSWLVGAGFGTAATAFIAQNYGAGKWSRIHGAFKTSLAAMSAWGLMISIFLFVFSERLIAVFLSCPDEIALGGQLMRILALVQIPQSFEGAMAACFRGRGVTIKPSTVSITCNSLRVVLAYFLNIWWGVIGIWVAICVGAGMRGVILLLWFLWDRRKLPNEDIAVRACLETRFG
ncbi:MAG: MATE family efflux transporter [Defluviitaleaceae bacterium]|nr:MATE family efflux transporter [Defluviitaleaceae bacterium]